MKTLQDQKNSLTKDISLDTPPHYMQFIRIIVEDAARDDVKEMLSESLSLYWQQEGIKDVRIMESAEKKNMFTIITQWQHQEFAYICNHDEFWHNYNRQWNAHIKAGKIKIIEVLNDNYELIE